MDEWVRQVNNEVENLVDNSCKPWGKQSIYRVAPSPSSNAYTPQKVSIGPYHHGAERLEAMEEHKHRSLLRFLKRSGKHLQCYVDALAQVEDDLKAAYDQLDHDKWNRDTGAFLKLMVVDGCFVLELMRAAAEDGNYKQMGYAENDPVFSSLGMVNTVPQLRRDILMLENQIPMMVLVLLYGVENNMPVIPHDSELKKLTTILILKFLCQPHGSKIEQLGKCAHILHVYQKSLVLSQDHIPDNKTETNMRSQQVYSISHSATYLRAARIQFKPSRTRSLTDISFDRWYTLKLPLIVVDDAFEAEYLNMMAFERHHVGAGSEVTSYIFFMSSLIRDASDVRSLSRAGVLEVALGSDQAVVDLLSSLSKDIMLDPSSKLNQVKNQVVEFSERPLNSYLAHLKLYYFSTPWTLINVFYTVIGLYLAVIQTVFTVLSYNRP